jgi:hypothetical protein
MRANEFARLPESGKGLRCLPKPRWRRLLGTPCWSLTSFNVPKESNCRRVEARKSPADTLISFNACKLKKSSFINTVLKIFIDRIIKRINNRIVKRILKKDDEQNYEVSRLSCSESGEVECPFGGVRWHAERCEANTTPLSLLFSGRQSC